MTETHRIRYYGPDDMTYNMHLHKSEQYVEAFDYDIENQTLLDVIEMHNVLKYLPATTIANDDEVDTFKKAAKGIIGSYVSRKELDGLSTEYEALYNHYKEDFWEIFVDYQLIKKTTVPQFQDFIERNNVYIVLLLQEKAICDKYHVPLKKILLKEPKNFELFLSKYDSDSARDYEFPHNISNDEINDWARRYCEWEDANPNYLLQLSLWSSHHQKKIDDRIILKAKRAREVQLNKYFDGKGGFSWSLEVGFVPDIPTGFRFESTNGTGFKVNFDKTWLDEERDYPTLMNNFIYHFGFFDLMGRFLLIGSQHSSESLFDIIQTKSKHGYNTSLDFKIKRIYFGLTFQAYFDYLAFESLDLEELYAFCYNELFQSAYNVKGFSCNPSPKENGFYDRCKLLIPEMDSVLKQFDFYQRYGEIDADLFEMQSKTTGYREIQSLQERKYIYLNSEDAKTISKLLFDSGSSLSSGEGSFYEQILNGATLDDFAERRIGIVLDYLENNNVIGYEAQNRIYFKDLVLIRAYRTIWESGYCSLFDFSDAFLAKVQQEVEKGNLRYGNTLFSEQESDYISYVMDDKKFSNTLAIRNKYTHGSFSKRSAHEHKGHYMELMLIMLLYTVKINGELDYQDRKKQKENIEPQVVENLHSLKEND